YNVTDNCNNQTDCHTTVTVVDCKKPTPVCKNGLVVELDPPADTIQVTVYAIDFNAGSFDNCPGDLQFSFSADTSYTQHTYYCEDVGQQTVQMWVTDASGNQDYCETFIIIQANLGQCPPGDTLVVNVSGTIANEDENPVENVMVNLSGESNGAVLTNGTGAYNFANIPVGNDVTVTPEKNDDPLNGVSTFDLVLITKHILGVQLLDSPYKLIAADANNSSSVTTADLVELRKLILAILPEFSNNTSWRFVDNDYVFPEAANPWAEEFPEVININDIPASVLDADFVAVKIGDVNGSANLLGSADERGVNPFILTTNDQSLVAGKGVQVKVMAADFAVLGYQFTLNFNREALTFQEMIPGVAKEENFGFTLLDKGAITTSWNGDASGNPVLFTLVFKARRNGNLSDYLSLSSRFTAAEAYGLDGALMNVELTFNGQSNAGFELYQNMPNPFKNATLISFNLPENSGGSLSIFDISGRVIAQIERDFTKGYNEIIIDRNELPASGVLYYTLKTATHTATRKMIVVE
ncbi:MAG: T9SS type A sorting domain-containing protein, partial [Saprospiraceae bacterium]